VHYFSVASWQLLEQLIWFRMHGTVRLLLEIAIFWHLSPVTLFVYNILIPRGVEVDRFRLWSSIFRILHLTYHRRDFLLVRLTSNSEFFVLTISRISANPPIQKAWLVERSLSTSGYSRYLSIKEMQRTAIARYFSASQHIAKLS